MWPSIERPWSHRVWSHRQTMKPSREYEACVSCHKMADSRGARFQQFPIILRRFRIKFTYSSCIQHSEIIQYSTKIIFMTLENFPQVWSDSDWILPTPLKSKLKHKQPPHPDIQTDWRVGAHIPVQVWDLEEPRCIPPEHSRCRRPTWSCAGVPRPATSECCCRARTRHAPPADTYSGDRSSWNRHK